MPRNPAYNLLRRAGWLFGLLVLLSIGVVRPGNAPEPVGSSVSSPPFAVLHESVSPMSEGRLIIVSPPDTQPKVEPTTTPEPTPTAEPEPTPAATEPPPPPPSPPPPPPAPTIASTDLEAAIVRHTNNVRADAGLPPLTTNPALTASARAYAQTLARNNWFDHVGPDGSTLITRSEAAGYTPWRYLAENLYRGSTSDSGSAIVRAWVNSSSHYANLVSPSVTEIGVGCAEVGGVRWCVQDFGDR